MDKVEYIRILVAIETDATRFHGERARRPVLLDRNAAEQALAHVSADLSAIFPEMRQSSLAMPGALFDQTQVLRPSFPVFRALEQLLGESGPVAGGQPRLLSLGADGGAMPLPELQPSQDIPLGMLLILPVTVAGDAELTTELAERMEHQFMERGQVSAHTAKGLEAGFGIPVMHARFMTMTDLQAMLRMQLEHFGFLGLWDLLYAALEGEPEALAVEGRNGQAFQWRDGSVHCRFETFDHWAGEGSGQSVPGAGQALARAYSDHVREYRQYLTTLHAHGVEVNQYLAGERDSPLEDTFFVEESARRPGAGAAQVTEHSSGDLGTIAVTVIRDGLQLNYYPLVPAGLNDLHADIRRAGLSAGGIAFPGCINYSERERRLVPDALPPAGD